LRAYNFFCPKFATLCPACLTFEAKKWHIRLLTLAAPPQKLHLCFHQPLGLQASTITTEGGRSLATPLDFCGLASR